MFNFRPFLLMPLLMFNFQASSPALAQAQDKAAIEAVIQQYGKAMNDSNVNAVLALYAKGAVFMPSGEPTAVGLPAIRKAYEHEFKLIDLDVEIVFDEIVENGNMAVVRTRSNGTLKILSQGKTIKTDSYRAFFVLQKYQHQWKIARFMFNFTNKR